MHLTKKEAAAAEAFRLSSRGPSAAQQRALTERLYEKLDLNSTKDPETVLANIEEAVRKNPSLADAARVFRAKYRL